MDKKLDGILEKKNKNIDDELLSLQAKDEAEKKRKHSDAFVKTESNESRGEKSDKKEKKSVKAEIFEWIKEIVIALVIVFIITTFIAQLTNVVGRSMLPTLHENDHIVIEKLTQRFGTMNRYDIIVFPHEKNILYIKRIIAFEGEKVEIKDGKCYVNGNEIDSKYEFELIEQYGDISYPFTVPKGEYFVLGDNRNNSYDSRYQGVGTVKKDDITGRAVFRIWPLNKIGTID